MSDTFTLREMAEVLRVSKRAIAARAARNEWQYQDVPCSGGVQRQYVISLLPQDVQRALSDHRFMQKHTASVREHEEKREQERIAASVKNAEDWAQRELEADLAEQREREERKQQGLAKFAALQDGKKKSAAQARQFFVRIYQQYYRENRDTCRSRDAARTLIVERINSGGMPVPAEHAEHLPQYRGTRTITAKTLQNWELTLRNEGIWGLVDNHGHRKGCSIIESNKDLYQVVLGTMVKHPHITAHKIELFLQAEYAHLPRPSVRAIQRFKSDWVKANHQVWTFITNPDRWKNVYMAAVGSQHENIVALNQLWEMDSTPADWMLTDGRHSVVGAIDLYSRRFKLFVSKTSSGYAVCQTFRAAAMAWGLPQAIRTDNGKDYVSNHFNTVLNDLSIDHILCLPFASEEKGTIERTMRTMSHGILDLLPGFIGHNVAERKKIEARKSFADRIMKSGEVIDVKLSAKELQQKLDEWCEYFYEKNPHGGLNGKTPWHVANACPSPWSNP